MININKISIKITLCIASTWTTPKLLWRPIMLLRLKMIKKTFWSAILKVMSMSFGNLKGTSSDWMISYLLWRRNTLCCWMKRTDQRRSRGSNLTSTRTASLTLRKRSSWWEFNSKRLIWRSKTCFGRTPAWRECQTPGLKKSRDSVMILKDLKIKMTEFIKKIRILLIQ